MTFPEIKITYHDTPCHQDLATANQNSGYVPGTIQNQCFPAATNQNSAYLSGTYRSQAQYSNPGTPDSNISSPGSLDNPDDSSLETLISNYVDPNDCDQILKIIDLNMNTTETAAAPVEHTVDTSVSDELEHVINANVPELLSQPSFDGDAILQQLENAIAPSNSTNID